MVTGISLIVVIASAVQLIRMSMYEFDHRTVGGVIEFSTYGKYQAHFFFKRVLRLVLVISIIVFLFGLATTR
jgi:uncharacterized membrane protein